MLFSFVAKWSLKRKITAITALILVVYGGIQFFLMSSLGKDYAQRMILTYENHARSMDHAISAQFFERYGDVQAFAENTVIKDMNAEAMVKALDAYVGLYGIYDVILVVDKNGKFVASNTKDTLGKEVNLAQLSRLDFSKEAWFQNTISGRFTEDTKKGFRGTYIEDFQLDPLIEVAVGEKRLANSFSAPIKDQDGRVVGVITNRANSKWIESEFVSKYNELLVDGHASAAIQMLNKDGFLVVYHNPEANGGKNEIQHDLNVLLKRNLLNEKIYAAEALSRGESSAIITNKNSKKMDQVVGFAKFDDAKFIASLGWGVIVRADEKQVLAQVNQAMLKFYLVFATLTLLALVIISFVTAKVSKQVDVVTEMLAESSKEVSFASTNIASSSTEISESATEQAAALQETVAAVDEIDAMVGRNAESAKASKDKSNQSQEAARRGRQTVENMLRAISEISSANDQVSDQMRKTMDQTTEIARLIADIGNKTKVINEIVFQTKLLSFNASVEAARAGEAGKGFAVVAEEVGNLAQMSGNAAKEISSMLDASTQKVNDIVKETQERIDKLTTISRDRVSEGTKTAEDCNVALDEILRNVEAVDHLVSEIATASEEQANGIKEISKAMGQMDIVTQQNTTVAQQSSSAAEQLNAQSKQLDHLVQELLGIVRGVDEVIYEEGGKTVTQQSQSTSVLKNKKMGAASSEAKVLKFPMKGSSNPSESRSAKKVSGSDVKHTTADGTEVPSANDPRFEDV